MEVQEAKNEKLSKPNQLFKWCEQP